MSKGITLIILLLFSLMSCKDDAINSHATIYKPVIDGVLDEWEGQLFSTKGEKLGFGVMNDDSTLYIALTTYDKQAIMQVLRGLTIWIDITGKKNKSFGIKYPLETEVFELRDINSRNTGQNEDFEYLIHQRLLQQNDLIVIDDGIQQYQRNDSSDDNIKAMMKYNEGDLVYELKIPLAEFYLASADIISIGIESVEMKIPEMPNRGSRGKSSGDMDGGMDGGRSGAGMGRDT